MPVMAADTLREKHSPSTSGLHCDGESGLGQPKSLHSGANGFHGEMSSGAALMQH